MLYGYLGFMVPFFFLTVGFAIALRGWEGRLSERVLPHYVRTGWLSPPEVAALGNLGRRHSARSWAKRVAGVDGLKAMRSFQFAATRLAILRDGMQRGLDRKAEDIEQTAAEEQRLLAAISGYRSVFVGRDPQMPQAFWDGGRYRIAFPDGVTRTVDAPPEPVMPIPVRLAQPIPVGAGGPGHWPQSGYGAAPGYGWSGYGSPGNGAQASGAYGYGPGSTAGPAVAIRPSAPPPGYQPGPSYQAPPTYQSPYQQYGYQQPGQSQAPYPQYGYAQPGYAQPGYPQPGQQPPGYPQPGYQPPGYPQPVYQQPVYQQPAQPYPGHPSYQQPSYQQPVYQQPGLPEPAPQQSQPEPSQPQPAPSQPQPDHGASPDGRSHPAQPDPGAPAGPVPGPPSN
jgi:hypothetical protein